jgi:integrase
MSVQAVVDIEPQAERILIGEKVRICRRGKKGTFQADFHHDGGHRRLSLKTRNEKEARRRALKLDTQLLEGNVPSRRPPAKAIQEAIQDFQAAKKVEGCSAGTLARYLTELQQFAQFAEQRGVKTLNKIALPLHDQYLAHRSQKLAPKTLFDNLVILRTFLKWSCRRKWIVENPLDGCQMKKPVRQEHMTPSLEQVLKLLTAAGEPYHTILRTLCLTGLRSGELQHLRPEDVDLEANVIHLKCRDEWKTKNGHDRQIPIHPQLRPYLAALPQCKRTYLFWNPPTPGYPQGREQLEGWHLNNEAQRLAHAAGIPVGRKNRAFCIHSLRHFFETECVHAGIPQPVIDQWMGHTDHSMGRVYYQLHEQKSQTYMQQLRFETQAAQGAVATQQDAADNKENRK